MILRTRSLLFSWVFATQHHTSPAGARDRPTQIGDKRKPWLPAPLFVELAGQVDEPPVALQTARIDFPGLGRRLHGALRFAQVEAVLESATRGPLDNFEIATLDVRDGHDRRGVVAHPGGVRQLSPGQLDDRGRDRRVLALSGPG